VFGGYTMSKICYISQAELISEGKIQFYKISVAKILMECFGSVTEKLGINGVCHGQINICCGD
jgi:hypothetical protein